MFTCPGEEGTLSHPPVTSGRRGLPPARPRKVSQDYAAGTGGAGDDFSQLHGS